METIYTEFFDSPVGILKIEASNTALLSVWYCKGGRESKDPLVRSNWLTEQTKVQLLEYLAGERTEFDLPLKLIGSAFQIEVWEALLRVPFGETRTYAQQAKNIGKPNAMRAVGAANGKNRINIIVPCHRIIGADGSLTGYGGGIENKAWLLNHEGALSPHQTSLDI
ncbi:methylated-DNA--[protein]-cysteine S-methyltransferase [Alteromonas oceanisediminis]|uniref:methylated-DNA--[protein]-cysteine S-methyltransferase n=1 Tax=Alteromonas oceanisediminis TaxID=2836180 RepID=UPI001BDA1FBF|nr:methylated-DNA--[protein]-cysteine S-methyltransferase [Alteromonas oceanisediminis]MBT0586153.1 methylated-DNA--[protein]-cysteine S-methyltransferase [Alteromonas oceanisediminis]